MKKGLLIIIPLVLIFISLQTGCSVNESDTQKILSHPPYDALSDSIRQFPDNPRYYLERGLLLSQNNKHEIATVDYKKAWELSSDEGVALEYASNLLLLNRTNEALLFLNDCRKKFPANIEFGRRISEVYAQTGRRKEALAEYDKMIEQDSLNFMAWYERGLLLVRLRDTVAALQSLQRSYTIQPINYTGLAMANIYSNQKDPLVVAICDDMLKKDSTGQMVDALLLKGIYYSDTKQYNTALSLFEECIKRDWKFTQAYIEKGIVLFDQKQYTKALEVFKMGATVSNTNADTYFWLGRCYEELKDKEQAEENFERALSLDRDLVEAEDGIERLKKN